ncbi:DDE-type integrase/transposase/recombinase [Methylocapsa acidiphila]|uniref:DDE-type integrase/transposase/recombinase n=1 Tax=Methylocapsa acidiphila TaxID=133552 RepID=UPI00040BF878|nr:DDE-type integrase/transposase/recombinase [Methylocapsa acidiphila]
MKIKGCWTYLYRAVDKQGKTEDFLFRARRDLAAARAFFRRAFKSQGQLPYAITLDAVRLRIGRPGKSLANIIAANEPKSGPRNISTV